MHIAEPVDKKRAHALLAKLFALPVATPLRVTGQEKIVLYGAGNLGLLANEFLAHVGITPIAVLDVNAVDGAQLADEIPVYRPQEYTPDDSAIVLVTIGNAAYEPIAETLHARGWKQVLPFYDYAEHFCEAHPLNNGWFSGALSEHDRAEIIATMDGWADDASRAAYLQFLAWRIARAEWVFDTAPVNPADRFFIPEFARHLSGDEVFVDAGAYDGRVTAELLKRMGGLREAHLIEPDVANAAALSIMLDAMPDGMRARVTVHHVALGDGAENSLFSSGFGMASRLGGPEAAAVETTTLDALNLAPTCIKLHLEGGELPALRGAQNTLIIHRPLLTLTVYHNRDGLWQTAHWLRASLPRYRFYFRAHSWCGTGAVIYAVPEER
jgi:FkbM family methyltransferase